MLEVRRSWAIAAVAAALACGGTEAGPARKAEDTPRPGGTVVIGAPSDLGALNGLVNSDATTQEIMNHALFMTLVRFDAELGYEPWLAESWSWEGDTVLTMRLRDDVTWSDGVPTTAEDVAWTLRRALDPGGGFPQLDLLADWLGAEVLDARTVRLRARPHADPLTTWASLAIMPAHALDSVPAERMHTAAFNRQPVTNGPFRFAGGAANDRWILEANPTFPEALGGPPLLDRVVWRVIPENAAQIVELETGNADLILSPRAEQLADLDARPGIRTIVKPSRRYVFVGWNGLRPPLDDARVRRALALATDRGTMLRALRAGHGTLAVGPIAPHHWAFDRTQQPLPFDVVAAAALLDSAGVRDRNGDGTRERFDGTPWTIELKIQANNAFNRDLAEMMQANLAAAGVRMEVRPVDFATLIDDISSAERRFDAVVMGWEADLRIALRDMFHSEALGGPFQLASYSNAVVDSLLNVLAATHDRDAARPMWAEVQAQLREDQPWMFLWYAPDLYAIDENVRGVRMDVRGTFTGIAGWWRADAPRP